MVTKWHDGKNVLFATLAVAFFVMAVAASGCARRQPNIPDQTKPPEQKAAPAQQRVKLTLYFSDKQAQHLVREERVVSQDGKPIADLVVLELIKGPSDPNDRGLTIPRETRLLSPVRIEQGTATVDFSKEFKTKHWGGSAGETMTVYSVVNSLTELEGIGRVVFLVEGKPLDSLGHTDLTVPVERSEEIIAK